jgi:hypothetical protein
VSRTLSSILTCLVVLIGTVGQPDLRVGRATQDGDGQWSNVDDVQLLAAAVTKRDPQLRRGGDGPARHRPLALPLFAVVYPPALPAPAAAVTRATTTATGSPAPDFTSAPRTSRGPPARR